MTDRALAASASGALANLEDQHALAQNPLLVRASHIEYQAVRSAILRALESLDPGNDDVSSRGHRAFDILRRCDLGGEPHKQVIDSMGFSRRQFYRERRQALLRLATAISASLEWTSGVSVSIELGDSAQAIIESLRAAGQYANVWREATSLAATTTDKRREIKYWIVASEAARYLSRPDDARDALDHAHGVVPHLAPVERSRSIGFWIAIGEMNLRWADADFDGALEACNRAVSNGPPEHTVHGDEAILFAIMLVYAASMELDLGRWDRARTLLTRATRLAERGSPALTGRFAIAGQSLLRLSAQVMRSADDDLRRSIADHRTALEVDRSSGQLGSVGVSAAYYAAALGEADAAVALPFADYGLAIVDRFYSGDRLARLTLELLPLLLRTRGAEAATEAVERVRRPGLGLRDNLFLDLAQAKISAHAGSLPAAIERAEDVAKRMSERGMHAWVCDAQLIAIDGYARLSRRRQAAHRLDSVAELLHLATRAQSRTEARRLGVLLAHH